MKIDLTKPVQTRDGRPARVVSEKGVGAFPVLALITAPDGSEHILRYTPAGNIMLAPGQSADDLVNVPETTEAILYMNVGRTHSVLSGAKRAASGWPVLKLKLKVGKEMGIEDVREVLSAEVVNA
jgi:hypothetical protein